MSEATVTPVQAQEFCAVDKDLVIIEAKNARYIGYVLGLDKSEHNLECQILARIEEPPTNP
jgi:hypothetical protein